MRRAVAVAAVAAFVASGCSDTATTTTPTTTLALASIVLSQVSVLGGTSVTGILTLNGNAPTGGAPITLSSSTASVTVPASITIPEGSNNISFSITTTAVAASTVITASYAGASQTATLTTTVVIVPALQSLYLSSPVATSGVPLQGTVTLTSPAPTGGLIVNLSSSSPSVTLPSAILVPFGITVQAFQIGIAPSASTASTTITASYAGVSFSAPLTIGQLALSIGLPSVAGGLPDTGIVSLPTPAPGGGAAVALTSNSPNAMVPASVIIPAGSMSQSFTIATVLSPPTTTATISATYGGVSQTANVTVVAFANLVAVSCSPTTAVGGTAIQCTGTLASPSPTGGWLLAMASSDPSVAPPPAVAVPAGATTFQFSLATSPVSAATAVTVAIVDAKSGMSLWTLGLSVSPG
jgi:hypothetical protein